MKNEIEDDRIQKLAAFEEELLSIVQSSVRPAEAALIASMLFVDVCLLSNGDDQEKFEEAFAKHTEVCRRLFTSRRHLLEKKEIQ